jgi:hypothetical protein
MSWFSKALGLDKHPKQLAQINAVSREAVALAERALTLSVAQLVQDRDFDAFKLKITTELAIIASMKTAELKDKIVNELLEGLK